MYVPHSHNNRNGGGGGGGPCVQVLHNIKKKGFNFEIDIEAHFFTLLVSYLLLTMEELYTFERVEASFKTMSSSCI